MRTQKAVNEFIVGSISLAAAVTQLYLLKSGTISSFVVVDQDKSKEFDDNYGRSSIWGVALVAAIIGQQLVNSMSNDQDKISNIETLGISSLSSTYVSIADKYLRVTSNTNETRSL
jgi:hypothetical protein